MDWRIWAGFIVFVLIAVTLDLVVFHRGNKTPKFKDAVGWTLLWTTMACLFGGVIWLLYERFPDANFSEEARALTGHQAAVQYFSCWLLEQSLSLDNVFVIALVFASFRVPKQYQHRVLFWGILGAIVMRGAMIGLGAYLVERFEWILYVFGALLLVSAAKLLFTKHEEEIPVEKHILVRLARKVMPVTNQFHEESFFVRVDGRLFATPLFLALILVEASDVLFAIDSVPAAFAVSREAFIIFTANAFAIFGLRSLYFVLLTMLDRFRYLQFGLVVILAYVGVKILLKEVLHSYHLEEEATWFSLAFIGLTLAASLLVSWITDKREAGGPSDVLKEVQDESGREPAIDSAPNG
ncbi:MAG TPA: TerC family protein [Pirellulaceae bacterium]|jgi:tellurite resistance protein TerC|nr:TerC family protein [Pirellulaceae bacterium]